MKKVIVHKSVAPFYIAAAVWVLYALLFPLYAVKHFILAAAASAVAFLAAKAFCKDVTEEIEVEPEPVKTGNEELDQMLADGQKAMAEMRQLDEAIADETISGQIRKLEELTGKIFEQVRQDPGKLPQIRKFMNYYLPTTLKLLNAYKRMGAQGVSGENITGTMEKVERMMGSIVAAFEKLLDSLFGTEAMDISADITVLEQMMAQEGLKKDQVQEAVQADSAAQADGDIRLQL